MSFADLLGGVVDDLVRGRTGNIGRRIQNYLATSARTGVTQGVKAYQDRQAEAAKEAAAAEAKEAARIPDHEAWGLLLAMIGAAGADGQVDSEEREAILDKAERAKLSEADRAKLEAALEKPLSAKEVAARIENPEAKVQAYAMALAAITVDTEAEKDYLRALRDALGLDPAVVSELEGDLLD